MQSKLKGKDAQSKREGGERKALCASGTLRQPEGIGGEVKDGAQCCRGSASCHGASGFASPTPSCAAAAGGESLELSLSKVTDWWGPAPAAAPGTALFAPRACL